MLEDEKTLGRDASEVRQAVTDVALKHSLVSRYTSFVAIEEFISRFNHELLTTAAIPNAVANGQNFSQEFTVVGYPRSGTSASLTFIIGLISAALALFLAARKPRGNSE